MVLWAEGRDVAQNAPGTRPTLAGRQGGPSVGSADSPRTFAELRVRKNVNSGIDTGERSNTLRSKGQNEVSRVFAPILTERNHGRLYATRWRGAGGGARE